MVEVGDDTPGTRTGSTPRGGRPIGSNERPARSAGLGERSARPNDRYSTLLEHHPDGVAVHVNGLIAYANPAMLRLAGAQPGQSLIGTPVVSYLDLAAVPEFAAGVGGLTVPGDTLGP